jgi:hypothetical protein
MTIVYVKPAPGARVRQPERGFRVMPEAGDHVERNSFYERLIISGDVVECAAPAATLASTVTPSVQPSPTIGERSDAVLRTAMGGEGEEPQSAAGDVARPPRGKGRAENPT